ADGQTAGRRPPRRWRARVRRLPDTVSLPAAPGDDDRGPAGPSGAVALGVGGDDAGVVAVRVDAPVVVAGPPGSGRSAVLRTLARGLPGRCVVVASDHAALRGLDAPLLGPGDGVDLARRLAADPATVVLVDDAVRLLDTPVEEVLLARARRGPADGGGPLRLVATADGAELAGSFRGLPAVLRTARTVLLLGRGGLVPADLLGRRPLLSPAGGPGAGFLVVDGTWTALRTAGPEVLR
ncbi:hypothetical protein GTR02_21925, partial [Kineococcus sp. R8]|uniref:ATP-binding protein n=1 Tax=Kineococcus siccus TaxID=2696567 RepID=UPI0023F46CEF